jgi:curved DNA-binding protein CbpA
MPEQVLRGTAEALQEQEEAMGERAGEGSLQHHYGEFVGGSLHMVGTAVGKGVTNVSEGFNALGSGISSGVGSLSEGVSGAMNAVGAAGGAAVESISASKSSARDRVRAQLVGAAARARERMKRRKKSKRSSGGGGAAGIDAEDEDGDESGEDEGVEGAANPMSGNFYERLGVERGATMGEVRKAYKKQAMRWHPDKNVNKKRTVRRVKKVKRKRRVDDPPAEEGGPTDVIGDDSLVEVEIVMEQMVVTTKEECEEKFKRVSQAYSVLADESARKKYNAKLSAQSSQAIASSIIQDVEFSFSMATELFNGFFTGGDASGGGASGGGASGSNEPSPADRARGNTRGAGGARGGASDASAASAAASAATSADPTATGDGAEVNGGATGANNAGMIPEASKSNLHYFCWAAPTATAKVDGTAPRSAPGKIISAWYGHRSTRRTIGQTVTARIQSLVQGDRLEIEPHTYTIRIGIDTAPGKSKDLVIEYTQGGKARKSVTKDGDKLCLAGIDRGGDDDWLLSLSPQEFFLDLGRDNGAGAGAGAGAGVGAGAGAGAGAGNGAQAPTLLMVEGGEGRGRSGSAGAPLLPADVHGRLLLKIGAAADHEGCMKAAAAAAVDVATAEAEDECDQDPALPCYDPVLNTKTGVDGGAGATVIRIVHEGAEAQGTTGAGPAVDADESLVIWASVGGNTGAVTASISAAEVQAGGRTGGDGAGGADTAPMKLALRPLPSLGPHISAADIARAQGAVQETEADDVVHVRMAIVRRIRARVLAPRLHSCTSLLQRLCLPKLEYWSGMRDSKSVGQRTIFNLLTMALHGAPQLKLQGAIELGTSYGVGRGFANVEAAVTRAMQEQSAISFGSGFVSGLGGIITLPVAVPAALFASWMLAARLSFVVARLYGHDVYEAEVATAVLSCVADRRSASEVRGQVHGSSSLSFVTGDEDDEGGGGEDVSGRDEEGGDAEGGEDQAGKKAETEGKEEEDMQEEGLEAGKEEVGAAAASGAKLDQLKAKLAAREEEKRAKAKEAKKKEKEAKAKEAKANKPLSNNARSAARQAAQEAYRKEINRAVQLQRAQGVVDDGAAVNAAKATAMRAGNAIGWRVFQREMAKQAAEEMAARTVTRTWTEAVPVVSGFICGAVDCYFVNAAGTFAQEVFRNLGEGESFESAADTKEVGDDRGTGAWLPRALANGSSTATKKYGVKIVRVEETKGGAGDSTDSTQAAAGAGGEAGCGDSDASARREERVEKVMEYYSRHDPEKATWTNANKLLAKYSPEQIVQTLEEKYGERLEFGARPPVPPGDVEEVKEEAKEEAKEGAVAIVQTVVLKAGMRFQKEVMCPANSVCRLKLGAGSDGGVDSGAAGAAGDSSSSGYSMGVEMRYVPASTPTVQCEVMPWHRRTLCSWPAGLHVDVEVGTRGKVVVIFDNRDGWVSKTIAFQVGAVSEQTMAF